MPPPCSYTPTLLCLVCLQQEEYAAFRKWCAKKTKLFGTNTVGAQVPPEWDNPSHSVPPPDFKQNRPSRDSFPETNPTGPQPATSKRRYSEGCVPYDPTRFPSPPVKRQPRSHTSQERRALEASRSPSLRRDHNLAFHPRQNIPSHSLGPRSTSLNFPGKLRHRRDLSRSPSSRSPSYRKGRYSYMRRNRTRHARRATPRRSGPPSSDSPKEKTRRPIRRQTSRRKRKRYTSSESRTPSPTFSTSRRPRTPKHRSVKSTTETACSPIPPHGDPLPPQPESTVPDRAPKLPPTPSSKKMQSPSAGKTALQTSPKAASKAPPVRGSKADDDLDRQATEDSPPKKKVRSNEELLQAPSKLSMLDMVFPKPKMEYIRWSDSEDGHSTLLSDSKANESSCRGGEDYKPTPAMPADERWVLDHPPSGLPPEPSTMPTPPGCLRAEWTIEPPKALAPTAVLTGIVTKVPETHNPGTTTQFPHIQVRQDAAQPNSQWTPPQPPPMPKPKLPPPLKPTRPLQPSKQCTPSAIPPPPKPVLPDPSEFEAAGQIEMEVPTTSALSKPMSTTAEKEQTVTMTASDNPGYLKQPPSKTTPSPCTTSKDPPRKPHQRTKAPAPPTDTETKTNPARPTKAVRAGAKRQTPHPGHASGLEDELAPLMTPPPAKDLEALTATFRYYNPAERRRTTMLMSEDPETLKKSLACWLKATKNFGVRSHKTYNHLLFCIRGVKISEFIGLFQGKTLTHALEKAFSYPTPSQEVSTTAIGDRGKTQNSGSGEGPPTQPAVKVTAPWTGSSQCPTGPQKFKGKATPPDATAGVGDEASSANPDKGKFKKRPRLPRSDYSQYNTYGTPKSNNSLEATDPSRARQDQNELPSRNPSQNNITFPGIASPPCKSMSPTSKSTAKSQPPYMVSKECQTEENLLAIPPPKSSSLFAEPI